MSGLKDARPVITASPPEAKKASKSSRPAWAIAWSENQRQVSMPVRQPLLVLPQRPQDPVPLERSLTPITTTRPSSRLSDHLTQEQQDVQAMSNDIAGRRALDEHRRSVAVERTQFHKDTPMAPSVPPAISVQAWDDQSDQVTTSSRTRIGNKSPAFTEHNSRYPRFEPSRVHEEMVRKETIRPPTFGGRSKNMQLGSVAESWGTAPTLEIPRGMFQLDDDPPSPPNGKTLTPAEIAAEKARRALLGIPGEKSGRPSIKDMEKEVTDKLKIMALNKERQKKDESSMQAVQCSAPSHNLSSSARAPDKVSFSTKTHQLLSEKLRERDVLNKYAGSDDDGW